MGNSKSYPSLLSVPAPFRLSISPHPPIPFFLANTRVIPLACTHTQIHKHNTPNYTLPLHTHCHGSIYSFTVSRACLYSHTALCVLFLSLTMNSSQRSELSL